MKKCYNFGSLNRTHFDLHLLDLITIFELLKKKKKIVFIITQFFGDIFIYLFAQCGKLLMTELNSKLFRLNLWSMLLAGFQITLVWQLSLENELNHSLLNLVKKLNFMGEKKINSRVSDYKQLMWRTFSSKFLIYNSILAGKCVVI